LPWSVSLLPALPAKPNINDSVQDHHMMPQFGNHPTSSTTCTNKLKYKHKHDTGNK
jgi:hypothetical protein